MTIYSNYTETFSSDSRTQPLTQYIGMFFLMVILLCGSMSVFGAETYKQTESMEKKKYVDDLVHELHEVQEKYPLLAERFGLLPLEGFRVELSCRGGHDFDVHRSVQQNCIDGFRKLNQKPDFDHCLALANRASCKPAVLASQ